VISGTTNLPDGMLLNVWLKKPWLPDARQRLAAGLAACSGDCIPLIADHGSTTVTVKSGRFSYGPISDKGAALTPSTYVLEITSPAAAVEPPEVRAVIGERGENITGPLAGGRCFGEDSADAEVPKAMEVQRQLTDEKREASQFRPGQVRGPSSREPFD
jgi:hypothetical protein